MDPNFRGSIVNGFHGCDSSVVEKLALRNDRFRPSKNDFDWLGNGVYFFEDDPRAALRFVRKKQTWNDSRNNIKSPSVLGAIIDLGKCLDLTTEVGMSFAKIAYKHLLSTYQISNLELPKNEGYKHKLDCAVVMNLLFIMESELGIEFDTVRGIFVQGDPLYTGAQMFDNAHIEICVINPKSIKAIFLVDKTFL